MTSNIDCMIMEMIKAQTSSFVEPTLASRRSCPDVSPDVGIGLTSGQHWTNIASLLDQHWPHTNPRLMSVLMSGHDWRHANVEPTKLHLWKNDGLMSFLVWHKARTDMRPTLDQQTCYLGANSCSSWLRLLQPYGTWVVRVLGHQSNTHMTIYRDTLITFSVIGKCNHGKHWQFDKTLKILPLIWKYQNIHDSNW